MLNSTIRNPEFIRLLRGKLRPKSLVNYMLLGGLIFGAVLTIMYFIFKARFGPFSGNWLPIMFTSYFQTVVGIQFALVALFGAIVASQNVCMEREKNTLDYQRLVGMGPHQLALGKLCGASLEAWCVMLMGLPFAALAVLMGAVPAGAFLEAELVILVLGLSVNAIALLCSSVTKRTSHAAGLLMLLGFIIYALIMAAANTRYSYAELNLLRTADPVEMLRIVTYGPNGTWPTFSVLGVACPALLGFIFMHAVLIAACYAAVARRLADDELSYLAPWQAGALFIFMQALLLQGGAHSSRDGLLLFHAFNGLFLVAAGFLLTPSSELLRGRLHRGAPEQQWRILFEKTNPLQDGPALRPVLWMAALYLALSLVLATQYQTPLTLLVAVMFCAMGIAVAGGLTYLQIYLDRAGFRLTLFLLIMALLLPPMLLGLASTFNSGIQFDQDVVYISPFAYLGELDRLARGSAWNVGRGGVGARWCCPLIAVVIAAAACALAGLRMRFLLDLAAREKAQALKESESATLAHSEGPVLSETR